MVSMWGKILSLGPSNFFWERCYFALIATGTFDHMVGDPTECANFRFSDKTYLSCYIWLIKSDSSSNQSESSTTFLFFFSRLQNLNKSWMCQKMPFLNGWEENIRNVPPSRQHGAAFIRPDPLRPKGKVSFCQLLWKVKSTMMISWHI